MSQAAGQGPLYLNADARQQAMYQQQQHMYAMYSKPNACAQPPTLYSNGPALMTPAGSPRSVHTKPTIMLDTDFDTSYMPSTPPLSASGSTVGSPASYEALQTPMNPMFSGLENGECVKEVIEPVDAAVLDWSSCGSPAVSPSKYSRMVL